MTHHVTWFQISALIQQLSFCSQPFPPFVSNWVHILVLDLHHRFHSQLACFDNVEQFRLTAYLIYNFIGLVFLLSQYVVQFQQFYKRPLFEEGHTQQESLSLRFLQLFHLINDNAIIILMQLQTLGRRTMRYYRSISRFLIILMHTVYRRWKELSRQILSCQPKLQHSSCSHCPRKCRFRLIWGRT